MKGLLLDSNGKRISPANADKATVRYRHYQSWVLIHTCACVGKVNACEAVSKARGRVFENVLPASTLTVPGGLIDDCEVEVEAYVT